MQPIMLPELNLRDAHMRRSIAFILDDHSIGPWCLGLTLLDRDLVAEVVIQDASGESVLLQRDPTIKRGDQGVVQWNKPMPRLMLTPETLDGWLDFSLKYYRDAIANVSHIDSELLSQPPQDGGTDVIIVVPNVRPPLSREELDRLIDELDKLEYDE
jgi:hypothetical protein